MFDKLLRLSSADRPVAAEPTGLVGMRWRLAGPLPALVGRCGKTYFVMAASTTYRRRSRWALMIQSSRWCRLGHISGHRGGFCCRGRVSWSPRARPTTRGPRPSRWQRHQLTARSACATRQRIRCSASRGDERRELRGFGAVLWCDGVGLWAVGPWALRLLGHSSSCWPRCSR